MSGDDATARPRRAAAPKRRRISVPKFHTEAEREAWLKTLSPDVQEFVRLARKLKRVLA